jgi:ribonucleotide reductase beta subunit family protein with ferritin-like domain
MQTIFNTKVIDPRTQPLFLGEPLGLARYDRLKYPKFFKLAETQEEFFWRATEISLQKDRGDYKLLSPNERFIFDSNLRWQTMTDSMLSRGISGIMQHITNPELEACCSAWSFYEINIHSRSYSHILKNVYPDETVMWNSILEDKEIVARASVIRKSYDDLFADDQGNDPKVLIFNALVSMNVTEALAFYVSFACSFFFGVMGRMEGNAKIIKFIERDERLHAAITSEILKIMRSVPEEGFQDVYSEAKIKEAYRLGVQMEKDWADYLFQKGNLLGLTKEQFQSFAEFRANERLKILGIEPIFPKQASNPLGNWYEEFVNPRKTQVAPQESELESYAIGARKTEINDSDLTGFSL